MLQERLRAAGAAGLAGRGQVRAAAGERAQVPERGGGAHAAHPVGPLADGQPPRLHAAPEGGGDGQCEAGAEILTSGSKEASAASSPSLFYPHQLFFTRTLNRNAVHK